MEPYYSDEWVTLYHGDCLEIVPGLARVNAVVTDPPFFMPATHYQSRVHWQRSWSDVSILGTFWRATLDVLVPRIKDTGHLVTFCNGDSYPVFYPEMYRRFDVLKCLVWDKRDVGLGRIWRHQHELAIAARWADSFVDVGGKLHRDVITAKATPSADRDHPIEKPQALMRAVIEPIVPRGGVVLDPFAGGGSTLLAARELGVVSIGIEMEERYCEVIAKRLAQDILDFAGTVA